ncbi:hypothetical protein SAMN05444487_11723 [Marininema mesophilum]|uniref:Uncharacterized protein n=1 Tax=Marininema mesophilum TaxID=1048340 RepID=A0A1H3BJT3_9BACL|nr:hypothetical protein [Marininema mesophilum]SDX42021.1 hypothetical protein SAMN05444487_11723 [Marininema mesophilum]
MKIKEKSSVRLITLKKGVGKKILIRTGLSIIRGEHVGAIDEDIVRSNLAEGD